MMYNRKDVIKFFTVKEEHNMDDIPSYRLYKNLSMFLNGDNKTWSKKIDKKELIKLERYLYQQDIPVTLEKKELLAGKVEVTLTKK